MYALVDCNNFYVSCEKDCLTRNWKGNQLLYYQIMMGVQLHEVKKLRHWELIWELQLL